MYRDYPRWAAKCAISDLLKSLGKKDNSDELIDQILNIIESGSNSDRDVAALSLINIMSGRTN